MRSISLFVLAICLAAAGCGRPVARLDRLSRVESAVLTDANAFLKGSQAAARPPIQVTDPDRLAALERFLKARRGQWKKLDGTPRPTRFQLELVGNSKPLYTVWLDPGYIAIAEGKSLQEARLSNAETGELLACLGLPPDYLGPNPMTPDYPAAPTTGPKWGVTPAGGEHAGRSGAARL